MIYLDLLKFASPEAIIAVTALAVLGIGLASTRASGICSFAATLGLALAIGAVMILPQQATLLQGMLVITPLTSLFKIICLALAFFTVLLARSDRSSRNPGEYLAMLLLATIGLMLLVGTEELLMIFLGLELTSLSLYVMTAFDKSDVRSAEAGLKYFLFGSTASAFTLFGLSFIYGMSGTTGLVAIGQKFATQPMQPLLFVGILMTLVGLAFKVAAAPFHLWAPDAYQGAPVASAAFIASGSKVASFVVLGKIVLVGAFGVVALVRRETGGDDLTNFSALSSRSPLLAGCMAIFLLSLAGLPPLAGFFGKFYLFSVALRAGANHGLLWLVALALLGSFISLYYYLIVLKVIFVDEKSQPETSPALSNLGEGGDFLQRLTLAVLAAVVVFFGVMPAMLIARIIASLP